MCRRFLSLGLGMLLITLLILGGCGSNRRFSGSIFVNENNPNEYLRFINARSVVLVRNDETITGFYTLLDDNSLRLDFASTRQIATINDNRDTIIYNHITFVREGGTNIFLWALVLLALFGVGLLTRPSIVKVKKG